MSFSNYLENKILDHLLGGPDYPRPTTVFIELYTVAPSDTGGGTPVSGGSYARAAVTNNSANWPTASTGTKQNNTEIVFTTPTADWGTIVAFGIFDALTGGNPMAWAPLTVAKPVFTGDPVSFPVGSLVINLD